jgi:hypothetical protein
VPTVALVRLPVRRVVPSADKAARTSIYLATSPDVTGSTGGFISGCKPAKSGKLSYDQDLQRRLYDRSLAWTGPTLAP